jgi:HPt (histidine-containing phosphotransfer) domain-containing protein
VKNLKKVIDLDYLITLSGGNKLLIIDMINLFISEVTNEIQLIEKGIKENDLTLVKSGIHSMKGIIHYVGLNGIVKIDLIKIEELAVKELSMLEIRLIFSKTKPKIKKAISELNDWMLLSKT